TNWLGFLFFYAIFFLAMSGTLSLLGIIWRRRRWPQAMVHELANVGFRQGFLLSLFATTLLFLQGRRLLNVWTMLAFLAGVIAIEGWLAWREGRQRPRRSQRAQVQAAYREV